LGKIALGEKMAATDSVIFEKWVMRRDADAFAELVSRHVGMVHATCRRLLRNSADAEEVAQECFVKLATHGGAVDSVGGWLHQVAVHASLDRLRAEKRRSVREEQYAGEQTRQLQEPDNWDDILPLIDEAIAALPGTLRACVVYRFLENQTHAEMGKKLGISRRTVQRRIDEALEELRTFLQGQGVVTSAGLALLLSTNMEAGASPAIVGATIGKKVLALAKQRPVPASTSLIAERIVLMSTKKAILSVVVLIVCVGSLLFFLEPSSWFLGGRTDDESLDASNPPHGRSAEGSALAKATAQINDEGETGSSSRLESEALRESPTTSPEGGTTDVLEEKPSEDNPVSVSISGSVRSEDAFSIPDAVVAIESVVAGETSGEKWVTKTSSEGAFSFSQVTTSPPFRLNVQAQGYLSVQKTVHVSEELPSIDNLEFILTATDHYVEGVVVDEAGKLVSGADVSLIMIMTTKGQRTFAQSMKPGKLFVVSDDDGTFSLPIPAKGTCTLHVRSEGYAEGQFPNIASDISDARLVITGFGAIAGRVTMADGSPAKGHTVTVMAECPVEAQYRSYRMGAPSQYGSTDEHGRYIISDLSPSVFYAIGVYDHSFEDLNTSWVEQRFLPLAYRDELRVEVGQTRSDVDVQLVEDPQVRLHGHVRDRESGEPAANVAMSIQMLNPHRLLGMTTTDEEGSYALEITTTDAMNVSVHCTYLSLLGGYGGTELASVDGGVEGDTVTVSPGDDLEKDFTVRAPITIPVRIVDIDGNPLPGFSVGVGTVNPPGVWESKTGNSLPSGQDGRAVVKGLPPDLTYFVWVRNAGGTTLRPPRAMSLSEFGPIDGQPGEITDEVVLVVEAKGGIEGVLVNANDEPLQETFLSIQVQDTGEQVQTKTNSDGIFAAVYALPPGNYDSLTVLALVNGQFLTASIPETAITVDTITDLGVITLGDSSQ
jgi:RNA polymerase sigma factor (sigma-70 family)